MDIDVASTPSLAAAATTTEKSCSNSSSIKCTTAGSRMTKMKKKKVDFPQDLNVLVTQYSSCDDGDTHTASSDDEYEDDNIDNSVLWYTKEEFQENLMKLHQAARELEDKSQPNLHSSSSSLSSTSSLTAGAPSTSHNEGDQMVLLLNDYDEERSAKRRSSLCSKNSGTSTCTTSTRSSTLSSSSSRSSMLSIASNNDNNDIDGNVSSDEKDDEDVCLEEYEIDKRCIEQLINNVSSVRQPILSVLAEQTRLREETGKVDPDRLASIIENVSNHRHRIAHLIAVRDAQEVAAYYSKPTSPKSQYGGCRRLSIPIAPRDLVSISISTYGTPTSSQNSRKSTTTKSKSPMRAQRRRDRISQRRTNATTTTTANGDGNTSPCSSSRRSSTTTIVAAENE